VRDSVCLALGTFLWMMGCVSPPDRFPRPEGLPVPDTWNHGEGKPSSDAVWWSSFSSPELVGLLEEAFSANPDLMGMEARVEAAGARARIAGADLYPTLGASLDGARRRQNFIGFPIPGNANDVLTTRATTYGLNFATSWEIDLWGRGRAGRRAALAESQAAEEDFAMGRLSLAAQVSKAWINAVAARQQWLLAQETAKSFGDTATKIQSRYQQGLRSALELQLASNSVESAQALVIERCQQSLQTVQQLELLLGRYPSGNLTLDCELPLLEGSLQAGIPSQVLERRPDLVAAERRLAAADQRLWESKAALFPQISLSGAAGTSTAELSDLVDRDLSVWSLAGSVAQPLLQGGRLRAGVDLSKAAIREAIAQYVSASLQAFREVEFALASEVLLKERALRIEAAATQSRGAMELANRRYESGLEELINVLESQRRSLSDATQVIAIRQAQLSNRIDLYLALGGGLMPGEAVGP